MINIARTYLYFPLWSFLVSLRQPSHNAILFYLIRIIEIMPMCSCALFFTIRPSAIYPLYCIEARCDKAVVCRCCTPVDARTILNHCNQMFKTNAIFSRLLAQMSCNLFLRRAWKILCDLNLNIAEISFSSNAFPFLFIRIVRFGGPSRPTL